MMGSRVRANFARVHKTCLSLLLCTRVMLHKSMFGMNSKGAGDDNSVSYKSQCSCSLHM